MSSSLELPSTSSSQAEHSRDDLAGWFKVPAGRGSSSSSLSIKPLAKATPVTKAIHSKKAGAAVVIEPDTDAGTESDRDGQDGLDIDDNDDEEVLVNNSRAQNKNVVGSTLGGSTLAEIIHNIKSKEVLPESMQGFDESSASTTGGNENVAVDESTKEDQDTDAAKASSAGAPKKKKKKEKVKDGKDKASVLGDITTSAVNGATGGSHGTKHPVDMGSDATETNVPQGKRGRGRPAKPKA